jgi:hypothetical protein
MAAVHRADAEARQRMVAVLEASLGRQPGVAFAVVFGSFDRLTRIREAGRDRFLADPTRRTSRAADCSSPSKPHRRSVTTCPPGD